MGECYDVYYRYMYRYYCLLVFYFQTVTDNSLTIFVFIMIILTLSFLWKHEVKKGIDLLQTVFVKCTILYFYLEVIQFIQIITIILILIILNNIGYVTGKLHTIMLLSYNCYQISLLQTLQRRSLMS